MSSKSKKSNNPEHDPSNDISTDSNLITCSFQIPKDAIGDVDIVKLNATPSWSYEEKATAKGAEHWARGKITSDFDSQFESLYENKSVAFDLMKRSYNIDLQRDEREKMKSILGLVKQSTRVTLSNYKAGIMEKLLKTGMSETEALKIINS